jgi:hypothetical protein
MQVRHTQCNARVKRCSLVRSTPKGQILRHPQSLDYEFLVLVVIPINSIDIHYINIYTNTPQAEAASMRSQRAPADTLVLIPSPIWGVNLVLGYSPIVLHLAEVRSMQALPRTVPGSKSGP